MRKSNIILFYVGGIVLSVLAAVMLSFTPLSELEATTTLQSRTVIPLFLMLIASVSNVIAWVGALVLAGRLGAWGWFIAIFLLGGLALLVFLFIGPDEYTPDASYVEEEYPPYPGMMWGAPPAYPPAGAQPPYSPSPYGPYPPAGAPVPYGASGYPGYPPASVPPTSGATVYPPYPAYQPAPSTEQPPQS